MLVQVLGSKSIFEKENIYVRENENYRNKYCRTIKTLKENRTYNVRVVLVRQMLLPVAFLVAATLTSALQHARVDPWGRSSVLVRFYPPVQGPWLFSSRLPLSPPPTPPPTAAPTLP